MTGDNSGGIEAPTIVIIGAGIAGLTAALSLLRQGLRVRVFEQASQFEDVGAGISLSRPASRGLFSLGLRSAIEDASDIPTNASSIDFQTGQRLPNSEKIAAVKGDEDIPYFYQLHRADMHALLADAVSRIDPDAITLRRRLVSIDQDDDGVSAHFVDGSMAHGSLLIGADGVNSTVRRMLFGEENPRFTGQVAYRFLVPAREAAPFMTQGPSANYVGPGRLLVRYVIRHGDVVNGAAYVRTDTWTGEGWTDSATTEELLSHFEGWHEDVRGLLRAAPEHGTRKWALFDRDPMECWTRGRATLMGDAAHPMLPFLGLGAAMGIEDAIVLGRAFALHGATVAALATYEASRRDRANTVLLASRRQGQAYQSRERSANLNSNDYLLEYDPVTAPLAV